MEIGGWDHIFEKPQGQLKDYLELMAEIWPNAIFEELDEPEAVKLKEVFVYPNEEHAANWDADDKYMMLYFIWNNDTNSMTVVSEDPAIPEMAMILEKIKNLAEGKTNG